MQNPSFEELAERFGTPLYVYDRGVLEARLDRLETAFAALRPRLHYSVKANSNGAILRILHERGIGFDVVSGGEIARCLAIGADPARLVFAGVGKTRAELEEALRAGIGSFNVESRAELELLGAVAAELGRTAQVALRVNPDVEAHTHAYISTGRAVHKFGLDLESSYDAAARARELPGVELRGCHVHIGSQICKVEPFVDAARVAAAWTRNLRAQGHRLDRINLGGGFGVGYGGPELDVGAVARGVARELEGLDVALELEPGRSLVADAGWLLGRVLHVKRTPQKDFVVTDAAMNDLLRPSLYGAVHPLEFLPRQGGEERLHDVVGPICETGDFLARDRRGVLPRPGDLLVVGGAGAYGFSMSSQYNSRPRPAEVLLESGRARVVRERETFADLVRGEHPWPD